MNLLLDTHLILWAAYAPDKLSAAARDMIETPEARLWVSVASLWEVAIKSALGRADFTVEPNVLRAGLLANGYDELPVEGRHVLTLTALPQHHADPFDRILVAQGLAEGMPLVSSDRAVGAYPGVRLV